MAKLTPAQKRVESILPPLVRRLRRQRMARQAQAVKFKEKRKRPRITIEELNEGGIKALKAKGITPARVQDPDPRSGFEVVLDWIDLPRNFVAQVVGRAAGVDFSKVKERGTFGLKRVTMSQVLDKLGVKQGVGRAVVGFIGDVAIDPLTYLTAGATTGFKIGRFLPRVTKPFFKQLRGLAKGSTAGLSPDLIKALGGPTRVRRLAQFAKAKGKMAQKRLLGRRGGFITRALERAAAKETPQGFAARRALQKGALTGRKLFRVPFTQIAGPTIPGKQARAFKALGDVEGFKALAQGLKRPRQVGQIVNRIKNLQREASQAAAAGDEIGARQLRAQAKKLLKQGREVARVGKGFREPGQFLQRGKKPGTLLLGRLARGEARLQRFGAEAPELVRMRNEALFGRSARTKLAQSVTDIFGPGTSPRNAQELAIRHGATQGKSAAFVRQFQRIQPEVDTLAANLIKKGVVSDNPTEVRRLLFNIIDRDGLVNIHLDDPVLKIIRDSKIASLPEVQQFQARFGQSMRGFIEELGKRGVEVSDLPGSVTRTAGREAKQLLAAQARRIGTGKQTSATFAGKVLQPADSVRTRMIEMVHPTRPERKLLLTRSVAKVDAAKADGWRIIADVTTDGKNVVTGPNGVPMAKIPLTEAQIANFESQGFEVIVSRWDPSAEMLNTMLKEDEGLRTILGFEAKQADISSFFDMDPATALAARASQHQQQIAALNLRDMAKKSGALVDATALSRPEFANMKIPEIAADHPLARLIPGIYTIKGAPNTALSGGRSIAYPAPVADMLDRLAMVFEGGQTTNTFLKATDMTLGWFKRFALFHPAYMIRNVWDNTFGIIMTGGNPAKSARMGVISNIKGGPARRIRNAVLNNDVASMGRKTMLIGGKNVPEQEIARFVLEHNMLQAGSTAAQTTQAFARGAGRTGTALGLAGKKGRAFFDAVRTGNSWLEENMRLGAFLSFLDDGQASRQALMNTTLAMPDLSNVTRFEQQALTRIFPWYRWAKNNGARQFFHFLPQKPAFIASIRKLQNLIQGMAPTVPDGLRPEWMREAQAAQISGDEESGSAFLLRNWFPFEEVQALTAGLASPQEAARFVAASTRPGIKFVAELATGSDIFRQRRTQPFTLAQTLSQAPAAFLGASGTPLDNFLAIRPLREFRRVGEQPDILGKGLRTFLGGAIQPLSAERGRQEIDLKTRDALRRLRIKINRARENQDTVEEQSLLRRFMQLQVKRQRTGLQIPKATIAALEAARQ